MIHSPLTRPKEWSTFIGSNLGEALSLHRFSYIWCETLKIYNLNMQKCKPSCKRKTESGMISMSDENQD